MANKDFQNGFIVGLSASSTTFGNEGGGVQFQRKTEADWLAEDPILKEAEFAVVDTSDGQIRIKIGDGILSFSRLPYIDQQILNKISALEIDLESGLQELRDLIISPETIITEAKNYTNEVTLAHNSSLGAHEDIRTQLQVLATKLNNFLDVSDEKVDQLSEILTLISNNKGTLESLLSGKVNVTDIVDGLESDSSSKVLSARQGKALKELVGALENEIDNLSYTNLKDKPLIPTHLSQLVNDLDIPTASVNIGAAAGENIGEVGTPQVSIEKRNETTTFVFDYLKGEKGDPGLPGLDGEKGEKGDDGAPGKDGADGKDGQDGQDGVSVTHSWNGTVLTVSSASGSSSADLKGEKGDPGNAAEIATQTENGLMSAEDKKKLDGIENDAQVNQEAFSEIILENNNGISSSILADSEKSRIKFNIGEGLGVTIFNQATRPGQEQQPKEIKFYSTIEVPTKTSQLENDSELLTSSNVKVAAGSNINSVGTPTVAKSVNGNDITFTFDYLKGNKGADGAAAITWSCPTTVNAYSKLCRITNYSNFIMRIGLSQNNQVSYFVLLISTGHSCATITCLGGSGFANNSNQIVRITQQSATVHDVELYNTYGYNGATSISASCSIIPLQTGLTLTKYTAYTATSGTSVASCTCKASGIVAPAFYGNLTGNADTASGVAWSGVSGKPSYYDAKAIKGITRSGTTFTYTCLDGTTGTFTQQDNNTTYNAATTSAAGLMSAADKTLLNNLNEEVTGIDTSLQQLTLQQSADLNSLTYPGFFYVANSSGTNYPVGTNGHLLVMANEDATRVRQVFFRCGTPDTTSYQWYTRSKTDSTWSTWWQLSGAMTQVYSGTLTSGTANCGSIYGGTGGWVIVAQLGTNKRLMTCFIPRGFLTTDATKWCFQLADDSSYLTFYFYYTGTTLYIKINTSSNTSTNALKYVYQVS